MSQTLKILLIALGGAAILIGSSIYVLGGAATGHVSEMIFAAISRTPLPAPDPQTATMESEFGFYSALWIAYGLLLIATARNLERSLHRVPVLAAIFFAGGVGRTLAWLRAGPPHAAFIGLMAIELLLPLVFLALWAALRSRQRADP